MNLWMGTLVTLSALTILEVILGVDNLIFLAIITQKLPVHKQRKARQIGLTLAWVTRLILLASAVWLTKLTTPIVSFLKFSFSGRDIFLIFGGLFLLAKSTQEMHLEIEPKGHKDIKQSTTFGFVVCQIAILDIIFSLDSVLTAIGLTQNFWLMAIAITVAIIVMIFSSEPISHFIERHPTIKMLALSFLMLIGVVLIADGFALHIPRAYIYFAMGFSLTIEFLNILKRKKEEQRNRQ